VNLTDCVNETSISVGEVLFNGEFPVLLDSGAHDFFETRIDDIDLICTLKLTSFV